MMREVFGQYGSTMIGIVSMLLFVAFFAFIVYRTYRKSNKDFYAQVARMPLDSAEMENHHDRA